MIKTVKVGKKEIRLDNNVGWTLIYRDQFGRDIIPSLMPMIAGALDITSEIVKNADENGEVSIDAVSLAKLADGDALINALVHIGGFEFVDFIDITWAMAKNADDSIPEPREWVREFDEFPVDTIGTEVAKLVFHGMVSSKNAKRLNDLIKNVRPKRTPSISKQLSSQESNED